MKFQKQTQIANRSLISDETKNKRGFYGKPRYCKTCKAYKVIQIL